MNILEGKITKEKRHSDINGELTVVQDLFMGTYILGGGLPQSGGLARTIWKETLSTIDTEKIKVDKALILGFGGGGLAELISKKWPEAKITGVDIDPVIVDLGKKYLGFEKYTNDVQIEDADKFVNEQIKENSKYDLVCVDTYVGDEFPEKFTSIEFLKKTKQLVSKNGIAIFNRLYGAEDRKKANLFGNNLEQVFSEVRRVYPEANIMFVCK